MQKFVSLAVLMSLLIACEVTPEPTLLASCTGGYACLTIDIGKLPVVTHVHQHENLENTQKQLDAGLISALQDGIPVQGFGIFTQGLDTQTLQQGLLKLLQAEQIWSFSQGEGVTVAVIDSGVDRDHVALKTQVLPGYDFIENHSEVTDKAGHGTAVAAIIAAQGKLKGLAPAAKILPLRVLDENLQGSAHNVTRAVLYAANLLPELPNPYPAQVINLSLGASLPTPILYKAIQLARQHGVVVVAAAGNVAGHVAYPAAYPEVLAVGSAYVGLGQWQREAYSNYGKGLDLLAPMGGLTQTNWGWFSEPAVLTAKANTHDQNIYMSGTSVAAPQVAALAALLLSVGASPAQTETLLHHSSVDLSTPGWDAQTGYGLFNPLAALRAAKMQVSGPVHIQVLDQGSKQEVRLQTGQEVQFLALAEGNYDMFIWLDANQDHLWQYQEACAQYPDLRLHSGQDLRLELPLTLPCR